MHIRKFSRRVVAVGVGGLAVLSMASAAFAGTITTPSTNPYVVAGDGAGHPLPFTVVGSGFTPGTLVNIEQCNGKSPADPSWTVTGDCDLGSAPAAVLADASGNATFDAASANHAFHPFRGESPQSLFNCLSVHEPAMNPVNGLDDYRNCQVRVSTNNNAATADQAFLPIVLPDTPPPSPSCDVNGSVKIAPGVTATPSKKGIKLSYKGTFTNCQHFDGFAGAKYPINGGSFTMSIGGTTPGATCSNLFTAFGPKPSAKVSFKFSGTNPKNGKPATATGNTSAAVASVTEQHNPLGHTVLVVTINNAKSLFNGYTPHFSVVYDETQAQIDAGCAVPKKGLGLLHYGAITDKAGTWTPVNGASAFTLTH